jgi:hypothetical protein
MSEDDKKRPEGDVPEGELAQPGSNPLYMPDEVEATRMREQGLGMGETELREQRDPTGATTSREERERSRTTAWDESEDEDLGRTRDLDKRH